MDASTIMAEYGVKWNAANAWMKQLPKVMIPGHSKTYVKRADLERLIEDNTFNIVTAKAAKRAAA